jgi:hypothetical protein
VNHPRTVNIPDCRKVSGLPNHMLLHNTFFSNKIDLHKAGGTLEIKCKEHYGADSCFVTKFYKLNAMFQGMYTTA